MLANTHHEIGDKKDWVIGGAGFPMSETTPCGSRNRNLTHPFASVRDAAGTLPGPRRAANRMEVT